MSGGRAFLRAPSNYLSFGKGYGKSPVKLEDGVWRFPREEIFKARD